MRFTQARTTAEALEALAQGARPIAGGTDILVKARQTGGALPDALVATDRIDALRHIELTTTEARIGAGVTHADLVAHPQIRARFTAISDACALVGSPATRHTGTIGGNVMNGSPAMDTGAPLLALGARANLVTIDSSRHVDLDALWTGPGATSAAPDELLTDIVVSQPAERSGSAYYRLEYRRAMEIAVVGAAAAVQLGTDGHIAHLRVALAAVAPTILEVSGTDDLIGATPSDAALAIARLAAQQGAPISDLRASARYRRHCVGVMAARAVTSACTRADGGVVPVPATQHWATEQA